jgi:predicted MPP superfamily phosphohydrolase
MKLSQISRRKFLLTGLVASPVAAVAYAKWIEPTWLNVTRPRLANVRTGLRLVQFSDIHYKGDGEYLMEVVKTVNSLHPDFTCFTGDLIEQAKFLPETLEILSGIESPMFGVPGNHDYWSRVSFEPIRECFAATGGAWLMDESRLIAGGRVQLVGLTCMQPRAYIPPSIPEARNILLMHYPGHVNQLGARTFDLIMAGHSHGGQVRIPFYGSIIVPPGVDGYDLGLYRTKAGPLYVNAGIGYIGNYNFRFNCPPEITVIEI